MPLKACKDCRALSNGPICPNCKSSNLSDDWSGLLVVLDPESSKIASMMSIKKSGRYAIKVR
ncbi:MAG: transcription elongation factor subunit Spt4 [Candidatus Bathyarchaeia archaeon]